MIEITTCTLPVAPDTTPAGMAALLDGMSTSLRSQDREVAAILVQARDLLRTIDFNRWADTQTARAMQRQRRALLLRHKGRTPRQEGRSDA